MSSSWYAAKLGGSRPESTPPYTPPTPPVQQQIPQTPQYQPPTPPAQVQSARCPGCGSGNYGASALTPEARPRCYDCGYPIQQSGSGVGKGIVTPGGAGAATPARQVQTGGFSWTIGEHI